MKDYKHYLAHDNPYNLQLKSTIYFNKIKSGIDKINHDDL